MKNINLIIDNDYLAIKNADIIDKRFIDENVDPDNTYLGVILLYRYPSGDVDTLTEQADHKDIAVTVLDMIEEGMIDKSVTSVTLPSGVVVELATATEQ